MNLALIIGGDDPDTPDRDWMIDAACNGADPMLWYAELGGDTIQAKQVCATCPVRERCLDHAIDTHEVHGVWGGLAPKERRNVARKRRNLAPVDDRVKVLTAHQLELLDQYGDDLEELLRAAHWRLDQRDYRNERTTREGA